MTPLVAKLGGSTAGSDELDVWISALAASTLPLVIVPGGGPFADTVRERQKDMCFSDDAAHAMAILAMEQFGHVILDRDERFIPTRSPDEIGRALFGKKIPVWFPSSMVLPASEIPPSWDVTSDSLAAWLAGALGARSLLLIKQTSAFQGSDGLVDLVAAGIVDAAFEGMLPAGIELYLAGPRDAPGAGGQLSAGKLPGTRIDVAATGPLRKTA